MSEVICPDDGRPCPHRCDPTSVCGPARAASAADQDAWDRGYHCGLREGWEVGYLRGTVDEMADLERADNPFVEER